MVKVHRAHTDRGVAGAPAGFIQRSIPSFRWEGIDLSIRSNISLHRRYLTGVFPSERQSASEKRGNTIETANEGQMDTTDTSRQRTRTYME